MRSSSFLGGSFGAGLEDEYSDIDFLAVITPGSLEEFSAHWREAVSRLDPIVFWWDRQVNGTLINSITQQWLRIDVQAATIEQLTGYAKNGLKLLFDHDRIFESLPSLPAASGPNPARLKWQFEEFIRIVGLLPLALGRKEYLNSVTGAFYLRSIVIDLFIEETAAPNRGGALHLNRLISQEQKDVLIALPTLAPTPDAILKGYLAYAAAYLPRARLMAKKLGIDWPEQFEAATWAHLRKELSIERPYSAASAVGQ